MFEPVRVARAEERRQAVGVAEISAEAEPVGGGVMAFSAVGSWSNQACDVGMRGAVSESDLDRLVSFYVERGVEPRIEVCPFADETLLRGLAARGFTLREFETVLVREIGGDAGGGAVAPEGVELVTVDPTDDATVRTFAEVTSLVFCPPGEPVPGHMLELSERCLRHPRCTGIAAVAGGEIIGGGVLELADEVEGVRIASLFGGAVREDYRRRGIQRALIEARVREGALRGANVACIHTRPGIATERNAARAGFGTCYTKVVMAKQGEGLVPSP